MSTILWIVPVLCLDALSAPAGESKDERQRAQALVGALLTADSEERQAVTERLVELGPIAADELATGLGAMPSQDPLRITALRQFGRGARSALPALLRVWLVGDDRESPAREAIVSVGSPAHCLVADLRRIAANPGSVTERVRVVGLLTEIGDETPEEIAIRLSTDLRDGERKQAALRELAEVGEPRELLADLLQAGLHDGDPITRAIALQYLPEYQSRSRIVTMVAEALGDPSDVVQCTAVDLVGKLKITEMSDKLSLIMVCELSNKQPDNWQIASHALTAFGALDGASVKALVPLLRHANGDVRGWACRALREVQDPLASEPMVGASLLELIDDETESKGWTDYTECSRVRHRPESVSSLALEVLRKIGPRLRPTALAALKNAAGNRRKAIEALVLSWE